MPRPKLKRDTPAGSYFLQQHGVQFVSTGCTLLNCCLGGGWPVGRIVNIVGDKSSGKTLLAIEASVNWKRKFPKSIVTFVEAEAALDRKFAKELGMPVDQIQFIDDCHTVEELFRVLSEGIARKPKTPKLFVIDSLDALSDEAEEARDIATPTYGAEKARQMSQLLRRLVRDVEQSNATVMFISQVRDRIGVTFGRKTKRSGGRALDFYASQVLYLAEAGKITKTIQKQKRAVGVKIHAMVDKNKVGMPFRQCEFEIIFGYGVDSILASLYFLESVNALDKLSSKLNRKNIKTFRAAIEAQDGEKYLHQVTRINQVVQRKWMEIEQQFLPTKGKYR